MKKKIALIGGSGFIGHNLAIDLSKKGNEIFIVDSLSVNNLYSFKEEDVENKTLYKSILNNRIELLNFNNIHLQIRVKPMNKFTVPGLKVNCSIKMK